MFVNSKASQDEIVQSMQSEALLNLGVGRQENVEGREGWREGTEQQIDRDERASPRMG
jgi:hypothetical protein